MKQWYSNYDGLIGQICPDYEQGLDSLVSGIPNNSKRVLEIGVGTGNLTARIAQALPNVELYGIDKDETMLKTARGKLSQYANVALEKNTASAVDYRGSDTVVSSLVYHMMQKDTREKMFQKIYNSEVQTILVFDRVKGETPEQENRFLDYFAQQLSGKGLPDKLIEELKGESQRSDPMKLSELKESLEANGFEFRILMQNPEHGFTVYEGIRR